MNPTGKKAWILIVLVLSLLLGGYVRFHNLDQGRFTESDELRSVNANLWNPFLYLTYKVPVLIMGERQEAALFTTAFFGVLSLLGVFLIGRSLFSARVGCYAAFVCSLICLHVRYSRSGYAAILQSLLLLACFWLLSAYVKDGKRPYAFLLGLFSGCAFITYVPSYAPIAVLIVLFLSVGILSKVPRSLLLKDLILFAAAAILPALIMEVGAQAFGHSYFQSLATYGVSTSHSVPPESLVDLFVFPNTLKACGGTVQLGLLIAGCLFNPVHFLVTKQRESGVLFCFCFLAPLLFCLMAGLRVHTHFDVHYVYLLPFFSLQCGMLLAWMEKRTHWIVVVSILAGFALVSLPASTALSRDTFKIAEMTQWLAGEGISKEQIATNLDLREGREATRTTPVPGEMVHEPTEYFAIDWERMRGLYHEKGIRYLLTSGIGSRCTTGFNDPVLKGRDPLRSWPHPVHIHEPEIEGVQDFELYDLAAIFSDMNPSSLQGLKPDREETPSSH